VYHATPGLRTRGLYSGAFSIRDGNTTAGVVPVLLKMFQTDSEDVLQPRVIKAGVIIGS
jgi:hypothetical protein